MGSVKEICEYMLGWVKEIRLGKGNGTTLAAGQSVVLRREIVKCVGYSKIMRRKWYFNNQCNCYNNKNNINY